MATTKETMADPVTRVLEAAGERPWTANGQRIEQYDGSVANVCIATIPGDGAYRRAIVRAVNGWAGVREALRAMVKAFHDAGSFLNYGHEDNMGVDTRRLYEAYKQARAALAAMEGKA